MCLFKDKNHHLFNHPLVAEKDIVCYKQLYLNCANILVTPYMHVPVPRKCIQKNKRRIPFKAETISRFKFIWRHILGFSDIVTDGFIHTFSSVPLYLDLSRNDRFLNVLSLKVQYTLLERTEIMHPNK